MANTEERHVRPRIPSYDGTVSPSESCWELKSWCEVINYSTGIRYFWNSVTNATQNERPLCLPPPTTCSSCGSEQCAIISGQQQVQTQGFQNYPQSSNHSIQMQNFGHQQVPRLFQTYQCSNVIDILPTEHAHVASSTSNVPSVGRSKDALYLCFCHNESDGIRCWYGLNLGRGEEIVNENSSKQELITTMLGEPIKDCSAAFISVNSLIYRIYLNYTFATSRVQVLDIESQAPSWKEFTPLAKSRVNPCAVSMGGKIYVVGGENIFPKKGLIMTCELNDIEVLTSPKSGKWETLPINSPPKFPNWLNYFVVAFEDHGKLVMGSNNENCLYLYDVCTYHLERIDLYGVCYIPWGDIPPVVVGNRLFFFNDANISAYDLVERSFWEGTIVGIDNCFIRATCKKRKGPRLIYLGGGKLCLICYKPRTPHENTSTVHCCVFGVPDFNEQGGKRSLHGHLHSVHKFYIGDAVRELFNVLII